MVLFSEAILWLSVLLVGGIIFLLLTYYGIINIGGSQRENKPILGEVWKAEYSDGFSDEITAFSHFQGMVLVKTKTFPKGRWYRPFIDIKQKSLHPQEGFSVWEINKTIDGYVNTSTEVLEMAKKIKEPDLNKAENKKKLEKMNEVKHSDRDKRINRSPDEILQLSRASAHFDSESDFNSKLGKWYLGKEGKGGKLTEKESDENA